MKSKRVKVIKRSNSTDFESALQMACEAIGYTWITKTEYFSHVGDDWEQYGAFIEYIKYEGE